MNKLKKIKKNKSKEKELSKHSKNDVADNFENTAIGENEDDLSQDDIYDNSKDKHDILIEKLSESVDDPLVSKEQCMVIIKESIEKYLNYTEVIDIETKDYHYKCWLEEFSVEDFKNEFKNSLSGNYYNNLYHNLWDNYFNTDGFIIVNNIN